jgi:hypothetical protein
MHAHHHFIDDDTALSILEKTLDLAVQNNIRKYHAQHPAGL